MEDGSSLIPTMPGHLFSPLITGRGIGTETCGLGEVVPSEDLWFGSDT